jgi:hypothetical protein
LLCSILTVGETCQCSCSEHSRHSDKLQEQRWDDSGEGDRAHGREVVDGTRSERPWSVADAVNAAVRL